MSRSVRPSRRRILEAGAAAGLLMAAPTAALALVPTPRQASGPFYPNRIPLDHDTDLTRVAGQSRAAAGTPTQVFGRVLNDSGRPLVGAIVELWQCDARGFYHHPRDRGGRADPAFQGYGRTLADDQGGYRFRTIRPVSYPGRTPHIHFAVTVPEGGRLTTQMYVAGEPDNARDGLLNRIRDPEQRASVIVPLERDAALEPDGLVGRFDIVLSGS